MQVTPQLLDKRRSTAVTSNSRRHGPTKRSATTTWKRGRTIEYSADQVTKKAAPTYHTKSLPGAFCFAIYVHTCAYLGSMVEAFRTFPALVRPWEEVEADGLGDHLDDET